VLVTGVQAPTSVAARELVRTVTRTPRSTSPPSQATPPCRDEVWRNDQQFGLDRRAEAGELGQQVPFGILGRTTDLGRIVIEQ
jgi:hypothetical protein